MKNKTINGRKLAIIGTVYILILCIVFSLLNQTSMFSLYYAPRYTSLIFFATNFVFIFLKCFDLLQGRPKKVKKTSFFKKISLYLKKTFKKFNKKLDESVNIDNTDSEQQSNKKAKSKENKKSKKRISKNQKVKLVYIVAYVAYFLVLFYATKKAFNHIMNFLYMDLEFLPFAIFILLLLIIGLIIERYCKFAENNEDVVENNEFLSAIIKNCKIFIRILLLQMLIIVGTIIFENITEIYIQRYLSYFLMAVFLYSLLFLLTSFLLVLFKKNQITNPEISIPIPSFKKNTEGQGFVDYLEKSTGISMRSLWSITYIRKVAPIFIALIFLGTWISTGIVSVDAYQQAAVYRFGVLKEKILKPGLHFTFPYPIDKVEIYNTEEVNKITIGYKSDTSSDNLWTAAHGDEEYKLLLGGGDELVSINIRIEYKISDLEKYLTVSSAPENIMQGIAYELVKDKTISTDLESLLSIDRYAFANDFKKELSASIAEKDLGLEVVSVVLESIHPPIEIAPVFQELISAEITAEKYILDAEATSNVKKTDAENQSNKLINKAIENKHTKLSNARSNVAEFTAGLGAYEKYGEAYKYQKYLSAVAKAYDNANLVILGDGVDESALYFGSFHGPIDSKDKDEK